MMARDSPQVSEVVIFSRRTSAGNGDETPGSNAFAIFRDTNPQAKIASSYEGVNMFTHSGG